MNRPVLCWDNTDKVNNKGQNHNRKQIVQAACVIGMIWLNENNVGNGIPYTGSPKKIIYNEWVDRKQAEQQIDWLSGAKQQRGSCSRTMFQTASRLGGTEQQTGLTEPHNQQAQQSQTANWEQAQLSWAADRSL